MNMLKLVNSMAGLILPEPCPACARGIADYPSPVCVRCGRAIFAAPSCPPASSENIEEIFSCRPYDGALCVCVRKFKYEGAKKLSWVFGRLADSYIVERWPNMDIPDLIVPVPLHPSRLRKRGYNQAALIAALLSERLGTPMLERVLIKTRNTRSQAGLSREERLENLRTSFAVIDRMRVSARSIMLVDDVMTTGATLETCAEELLRAGARNVKAFTIARVL